MAFAFLNKKYMSPIKNAWHYFPDHKGKVTGLISCGFGISSSIFSFISDKFINPNLLKPVVNNGVYVYPPEVANQYKNLMLLISCILLGLVLIGTALTFDYEDKTEQKSENETSYSLTELIANREILTLFGIGFSTCGCFLTSSSFLERQHFQNIRE